MKDGTVRAKRGSAEPEVPLSRRAGTRLLLVPLLVFAVFCVEIYLFEGRPGLFLRPEPFPLLFYTVVTCVFFSLIVPLALIRPAFIAGDVNMYQLGFRSLRRTVLMSSLTLIIVWMAVSLQNPFAAGRPAFLLAFLLLLPTGIASAVVCWVLAGTHVQAFVRSAGVLVSIASGVLVTSVLFGLMTLAQVPAASASEILIRFIPAGVLTSVFFFAVRDVWATSIVVTGGLVYLTAGWLDPGQISSEFPAVALTAVLMAASLAAVHAYLSRRYVTIPAPAS